jgi:hypothetical protein
MTALRRTAQWLANESAKQEAELQRLVWPNGAPQQSRQSAARSLYPNHQSNAEWRTGEVARQEQRPTAATKLYPNLKPR